VALYYSNELFVLVTFKTRIKHLTTIIKMILKKGFFFNLANYNFFRCLIIEPRLGAVVNPELALTTCQFNI